MEEGAAYSKSLALVLPSLVRFASGPSSLSRTRTKHPLMAAAMDVDRAGGGERRPSEKELFRAAESGDAAAFASLAPADLSLRNEDGRSLLHVAAAAGHPQARKGVF